MVLGKIENIRHKISKKYLKYKIRLKMVRCKQPKVYFIKIWIWWVLQAIFSKEYFHIDQISHYISKK